MNIVKKVSKKIFQFIKKRYKLILIILVIVALIGRAAYKKAQASKEALTFENPIREALVQTLELSGYIDAKEKASMRFAAGGKLVYLGAKEGEFVKKHQTIASIDQRDLQKRLQKDLNNYMKERWDWDQQLDDIKDRTIDKAEQRDVDQNHWDLENTVLDVEIRDISISESYMIAPFAGVLVKTPATTTGVNLLYTDTFELINPDTLYFNAEIDEEDVATIRLGLTGLLTLDSYPDEEIKTTISYISFQSTETSSGTIFEVEFPLFSEGSLQKYRLGMNGDIAIILRTKENALTIPLLATKEKEDGVYVDVEIDDGKTEERKIEIGLETEEKVEILSGLNENDKVLIPE